MCNAGVQVSDGMLWSIFVSRTFVSASRAIIEETFKLATVQKSAN